MSQGFTRSIISLTGDSGGALQGSSFLLTGGSTGLTFSGSGTTETLGGILAIGNGGSNASSFGTSNGIVVYNGTRLVNYSGPQIDSSGRYTNTSQPAFMAFMTTALTNKTGDGTTYTVLFDSTSFSQGITYASGTGLATVPIAGRYFFYAQILLTSVGAGHTGSSFDLQQGGSATNFFRQDINPANCRAGSGDTNDVTLLVQGFLTLAASDTFKVNVTVTGSTKTVGVFGNATQLYTSFGGWLVC